MSESFYELPAGVRLVEPSDDRIERCKRLVVPVPWRIILVDVTLRRTADNLERTYIDTVGFEVATEGQEAIDETIYVHARYQWQDGNYGCDCNRRQFFAAIGDDPIPEGDCGHGEYIIAAPDWLEEVERSPIGWYGVFKTP